jgi:hypothetical protein
MPTSSSQRGGLRDSRNGKQPPGYPAEGSLSHRKLQIKHWNPDQVKLPATKPTVDRLDLIQEAKQQGYVYKKPQRLDDLSHTTGKLQGNDHNRRNRPTTPYGAEIQQMVWPYSLQNFADRTVFKRTASVKNPLRTMVRGLS